MRWGRRLLVGLAITLGGMIVPSAAFALDPADSISVSAPSGPIYAGYPFNFTGGGTVDGDIDASGDYGGYVVWAPTSPAVFGSGCPQSYAAAEQAIDFAGGGPDTIYSYEAEEESPVLLDEAGPYTYTAAVNDDIFPALTAPGDYVACAYLTDAFAAVTYAVSPAPVPFTVVDPPGTTTAPGGFGGPRGRGRHPADLTLKVGLSRPRRDPGNNLIDVSGQFAATDGPAFLYVDVKSASRYDGCASNDQQDQQITLSDGGVELANSEQTTPSGAGVFRSPLALDLKRRVAGTYVVCAYLDQDFADIAVGFDRITVPRQTTHRKRRKHIRHTRRTGEDNDGRHVH